MDEVRKFEGCRGEESAEWPMTVERLEVLKGLAKWVPSLVDPMTREINDRLMARRDERPPLEAEARAGGLREALPYRRDCAVCIEAAGRDRCRRKLAYPEACSWSVDRPFQQGKDLEVRNARYFMAHTVRIPLLQSLESMRSEG